MQTAIEQRQQRAKIWADMCALNDKAKNEKRDLTSDEHKTWEAMNADVDRLDAEVKNIESRDELIATRDAELRAGSGSRAGGEGGARGQDSGESVFEYTTRFGVKRSIRLAGRTATKEYNAAFASVLRGGPIAEELRALEQGSDPQGGYLLAPQQFAAQLIKAIDDQTFIRGLATVTTVTQSDSLGQPVLVADPSDPEWTTELATGTEDSAMQLGKREWKPNPLAKRIRVSKKLMRSAAIDPVALVLERLAYKFSVAQEKGFLTGSGASKPLGLFTASSDGIPTTRDVQTGSATDFTADGLIDAKYALKGGYWPNARWILHRDGVKRVRKLKDSDNQYLWGPGLNGGEPNRLLDIPTLVSEFAPNTFTTGLYVGILGDFRFYHIADALSMTVQRLVELYAESNQDGFIGRLETDGMPVLAEAFIRLKTN